MRPLKPVIILVGGPALSAVVAAACFAVFLPDVRDPRSVAIGLGLGAILGLLIFGPLAAGGAMPPAFVVRHFERFERWSAFTLALGLGHWIGTQLGNSGFFVAYILIFASAGFRVYLSMVAKRLAA